MVNKKKLIISLTIILALFFLALAGYLTYQKAKKAPEEGLNKVLAQVADKKITQRDWNERAYLATRKGSLENPEVNEYVKDSILDTLIKERTIEFLAQQRGISTNFSEEEIKKRAQEKFSDFDQADPEIQKIYQKIAYFSLLEDRLREKVLSWREGKVLLFRYDRSLQVDYTPNSPEAQALREKQKNYAQKYSQEALTRLINKTSSYDQEKEKLLNDPVIGPAAWKPWTMTFAIEFNKENFEEQSFVIGSDLKDKIFQVKAGEMKIVEVKVLEDEETGKMVDGIYALVIIDQEGQKGETTNFEDWLEKTIQAMKENNQIKIY